MQKECLPLAPDAFRKPGFDDKRCLDPGFRHSFHHCQNPQKNYFCNIADFITGLSTTPFAEATCDAKNHKGGGRILLLEITRRALYIAFS